MILAKLLEIQKATRAFAADKTGQTGAASYGYVSGSKILSQVRPMMDNLGVLLSQEITDISNTPITYTTSKGQKTEIFTSLRLRFTWIDTEDQSTLVNDFAANGMNAFDKGLGSALTYGERYYLLKFFHIATDKDDVDAIIRDEAIDDSAQNYTPLPDNQYWKVVSAEAHGIKNSEGITYREAFIKNTHPTKDALRQFDEDVREVKDAISQ